LLVGEKKKLVGTGGGLSTPVALEHNDTMMMMSFFITKGMT
jgi:hypothetical protein